MFEGQSISAIKQKILQMNEEEKNLELEQILLMDDRALKNYRVTATFGDDESLENMLYLLQRAVNFSRSANFVF